MPDKKQLSDHDIKKSFISSIKYVAANLMTSALILAMLFVISIIIGLESNKAMDFLNGSIFQTIMLPLIIWYYGYLAYNEGYRHSVAGTYNKKRILISALPMFVLQVLFVVLSINEAVEAAEIGTARTIAIFLLNPFAILFNTFPKFMPEIMILPCFVPPAAMYVGYYLSRFKEVKDHSMKEDAMEFRRQLEEIQYNRKNTHGDNQ